MTGPTVEDLARELRRLDVALEDARAEVARLLEAHDAVRRDLGARLGEGEYVPAGDAGGWANVVEYAGRRAVNPQAVKAHLEALETVGLARRVEKVEGPTVSDLVKPANAAKLARAGVRLDDLILEPQARLGLVWVPADAGQVAA